MLEDTLSGLVALEWLLACVSPGLVWGWFVTRVAGKRHVAGSSDCNMLDCNMLGSFCNR